MYPHAILRLSSTRYTSKCSSRVAKLSIPSVSHLFWGMERRSSMWIVKFFPSRFVRPFTVDVSRLIHWETKGNANDDYTSRARGRYTHQLYTSNCCKFSCIHHGFSELLTFYINVERWWNDGERYHGVVKTYAGARVQIAYCVCEYVRIGTRGFVVISRVYVR